jgi:ferric-dicitrate binding protein FerR (iron transport regulator)
MDPCPEINWHRLVRYLSGEASSDQRERTQEWILDDERRARVMDELKRVWDATESSPRRRDVDAAWETVSDRLEADVDGGALPSRGDPGHAPNRDEKKRTARPRHRRRDGWRLFLRVGAFGGAIAAAALLVVLLLDGLPSASSGDQDRTFSTKPGERATVHLSDGTKVRLNVDSRLTLPGDFGEGTRAVDLTGEAYFEVVRDTSRPFVVRVDGATAEVLGTAFDVRAYADDAERRVAVAEGAVALRPERAATRDTVLLRARHLGIVSGPHVQTVRRDTDIERWLAWTSGQLVFDDTPFEEVVPKLERWYDIRVETRVDPSAVDRLNATFEEESVGKAIKAIAAALDLQYRRDEQAVIFYRQGTPPGTFSG